MQPGQQLLGENCKKKSLTGQILPGESEIKWHFGGPGELMTWGAVSRVLKILPKVISILLAVLRVWAPACWPSWAVYLNFSGSFLVNLFYHKVWLLIDTPVLQNTSQKSTEFSTLGDSAWRPCCGKAVELVLCSIILAWEYFVQSPN